MKNFKSFSRAVRQELSRLSAIIKQMEFRVLRFRGILQRKLRQEIKELQRMKNSILHRLFELSSAGGLHTPAMQYISNDIALLNERCRRLKAQHF